MAGSQDKQPRTITEEQEQAELYNTSNKCSCLGALFPCFGRRSINDHAQLLHGENNNDKGTATSYLQERLKEARDWTETVGGPKWKNFLRRTGAYFSRNERRRTYKARPYDYLNYAMNFEEGFMDQEEDEVSDRFTRGFSAKYAAGPFYQGQEDINNMQAVR